MSFISPGYAIIVSVQGVSPGPASGISYTVRYHREDGSQLPDVANQVPFVRETAIPIVAHPVGFTWPIVFAGGRLVTQMPLERSNLDFCGGEQGELG